MSLIVCGAQRCFRYLKGEWHPMYLSEEERGREILELIVHLVAGVLAAAIAYKRMDGQSPLIRLLVALVAFMFGMIYLVYVVGVMALDKDDQGKKYLDIFAEGLQGGYVAPLV